MAAAASDERAVEKNKRKTAPSWKSKCRIQIRGANKLKWHSWVNSHRLTLGLPKNLANKTYDYSFTKAARAHELKSFDFNKLLVNHYKTKFGKDAFIKMMKSAQLHKGASEEYKHEIVQTLIDSAPND